MDYKKSKSNYVDRDVSWMYFNHRILQESEKEDIPVLERMSYLGIYSNNLDEFFRVRMATLNRMVQSKEKTLKEKRFNMRQVCRISCFHGPRWKKDGWSTCLLLRCMAVPIRSL